jgi:hypothetical protein
MIKNKETYAFDLIKSLYDKKIDNGIKHDIYTILNINLLRSLLRLDCEDYHIVKAILSITDINKTNSSSFERIVKKIITDDLVAGQKIIWRIIIPFEININRRVITVNGIRFKLCSFSTFKKENALEYFTYYRDEGIITKKIENKKCKFLVTESSGLSLYRAWKEIEPTFSIIRGLLDYALSMQHWSTITKPQVRTKIPHPNTIYGKSTLSRSEYLEFMVPLIKGEINDIIDKKGSVFDKFSITLRDIPRKNSIQDLLFDIFRLYSQAMDEDDVQYCFLKFWQIAERIALTDPSGPSNDTIKKRIGFFTEEFSGYNLSSYIDKLSKKRNDLVHRGIDRIELSDLNVLKIICDKAILWLHLNKGQIKTIKHLELFYNSRNFNNNEIQTTFDILTYIKNDRNK